MGSKTYKGVRFSVYPNDHLPPHVHGAYSGVTVVIDLMSNSQVAVADRKKSIVPPNAPRNAVSKIIRTAAENFDELLKLWEETHGAH